MSSRLAALQALAQRRLQADLPGTLQWINPPNGVSADVVAVAVRIGVAEREAEPGGFSRVRTATVWVALADMPTIPDLETRCAADLVSGDQIAERFRLMEAHTQATGHWLLRFGQW